MAAVLAILIAQTPIWAQPNDEPRFHTDPDCWAAARVYHPGPPSAELVNRVHLLSTPAKAVIPGEPTISPNGGYAFWVRNPDTANPGPWNAALVVDVEDETRPTLLLENVARPIQPRWLTEKLVYLRVAWSRRVFSDLILDVENSEVIYHEQAVSGENVYRQRQQACGGPCPCDDAAEPAAPGDTSETQAPEGAARPEAPENVVRPETPDGAAQPEASAGATDESRRPQSKSPIPSRPANKRIK